MSGKPLVSVLTPCWNGEKYVGRLLDSLLEQTYEGSIELLIVDDGSTDRTADVIKSYIPKFEAKNYSLRYFYQENGGVSSALNMVLDKFNGDYMTWIDADDYMTPDSLEKRVKFLEENPQYGFCVCQMPIVHENDLKTPLRVFKRQPPSPPDKHESFFWDLLHVRNIMFSDVYLVRREAFLKAHPTRQIYPSREGQNWQLLLPLAHRYKLGYVNEELCVCVRHVGSHSSMNRSPRDWVERNNGFAEILLNTIPNIPLSKVEAQDVPYFIRRTFLVKAILAIGIQNSNRQIIDKCLQTAREYNLAVFNRLYSIRDMLVRHMMALPDPKRVLDWLMPFLDKARSRFCGEGEYMSKAKSLDAEGIEINDGFIDLLNHENFYVILSDNYARLRVRLLERGFKEDLDFIDGRVPVAQ